MNLDPNGVCKYNQLKGAISPEVSCNVNAICCGFEASGNKWPTTNYHNEFTRVPDKLIYFLRHEPMILEMYKFMYATDYNKWMKDRKKDKDLYSDNSIPPNEVLKLLCIGFNLFLNLYNGDEYTNYCSLKRMNLDEIKKSIDNGKAVVSSFNLNGFGHIMTTVGYNAEGFLVEDSYGMNYLKNHKDIAAAKLIPFDEYKKISKPTGLDNKLVITYSSIS